MKNLNLKSAKNGSNRGGKAESGDSFNLRYNALNKAQKDAVDAIEGPVLVVAGPGSGKTEILGLRVAKILREAQVLPSQILCLTFTDSASINMRNRLAGLIGDEAYKVSIHTFHNFCVSIISRNPEYFYKGTSFSPADTITKTEIIEGIIEKLSFDNPLRVEHPEKGYIYLSNISKAIEALKKSGLLPDDFKKVLKQNSAEIQNLNLELQKVFTDRISKDTAQKAQDFLKKFSNSTNVENGSNNEHNIQDCPPSPFPSLTDVIIQSLKKALDESLAGDEGASKTNNKPLTEWKSHYLKNDHSGEKVLSETLYQEKMLAVADVYEKYRQEMHDKALFDFDDMILDVIESLKKNKGLLVELQEQFQYILVDEFQDTNEAQMTIVKMIADAPVNEGRPNVMVVGDDDQAVYRFQGAELSNILNFRRIFNDVKVVTMTDNYRSTQEILDVASHIIKKGKERLEYVIPEMEKNLIARNAELNSDLGSDLNGASGNALTKSRIRHIQLPSKSHECHYISREIKRLIDAGTDPADIAVISRKHEPLETLVPFMKGAGVPIKYEREQNVLTEPHIQELVIMARYISSLIKKEEESAEDLLPKIFSFSFWKVPRIDVWKLSMLTRQRDGHNLKLIEVALESENQQIKNIAEFLIDLAESAHHAPLELILDRMVGAHVPLIPESENDEDTSLNEKNDKNSNREFFSPFKNYYFSKDKFSHARSEYLTFLSSLRVFVGALKDFRKGEDLTIHDLVEFVSIHEKNNIPLNDRSPFANALNAVELLTAHKAKGLEFDTVFIMSCQDEVWAGRGIPNSLPMPSNLPIYPAGDNEDDKLRLFYVALTRAKRHLYLTSYISSDDGKESSILRFIVGEKDSENIDEKVHLALQSLTPELNDYLGADSPNTHEVLTASWVKYYMPPFLNEETALLKTLLKDYKLSITHLNNFLNLEKGGPELFFEQNLLRFPQAKTPAGSFGTAIHQALEEMITKFKQDSVLPDMEFVEQIFIKALRRERIGKENFRIFSEKGLNFLKKFISERKSEFSLKDLTEISFADQSVILDGAVLTGKIDRISNLGGGDISVHDYKTGKPQESWTGGSSFDKTKLYQFRRQLAFYKILIENSRNYQNLKMKEGIIDFVEPKNDKIMSLKLDMETDEQKTFEDRIKKLSKIIYEKIMNLDFPDVSKFSADYKGMIEFEDFLLG